MCNEEAPWPSSTLFDGHREEGGGREPPWSCSNSRLATWQDESVTEIQRETQTSRAFDVGLNINSVGAAAAPLVAAAVAAVAPQEQGDH